MKCGRRLTLAQPSFFALFFYMHLTASRRGFNIYPLQLRQVVEQDNKKFYVEETNGGMKQ